MKNKIVAYGLAISYVLFFAIFGVVEYDFTKHMSVVPDPATLRTVEIEGFYGQSWLDLSERLCAWDKWRSCRVSLVV